jgi:hypothetical protein
VDRETPSTRYKDLVDLVAIVTEASVTADPQMKALRSEAERRGITLPSSFTVPDWELWDRGYAAEAARSLLPIARTLDEALAVIGPFVDPLLGGVAVGRWEPRGGTLGEVRWGPPTGRGRWGIGTKYEWGVSASG